MVHVCQNQNHQLAPPPFDDLQFRLFDLLALAADDVLLRVLRGVDRWLLLDQLAPPPFPDDDLEEGERRLVLF